MQYFCQCEYHLIPPFFQKKTSTISSLSRAGLVSFGIVPLGAELCLENTYPLDPAAGVSLVFGASTTVTVVVIISLIGLLEQDLSQEKYKKQVQSFPYTTERK